MSKNPIYGIIAIFILALTLTACSNAIPETQFIPASTIPTSNVIPSESQDLIHKTASAMGSITSFNLDSDITETYSVASNQSISEWKGTKLINIADKSMLIDMTVNTTVSNRAIPKDSSVFEMYFFNGWEYVNITNPASYSGWQKTHQYDAWWLPELQIPNLIELLNTAQEANLASDELINGTECFVLNLTPSANSVSDWILSQHQIVGSAKVSAGGVTIYDDKNNQGSLKLWISKDNYLVTQLELNYLRLGKLHVGSVDVGPQGTSSNDIQVTDSIYGHMNFHGYNETLAIQPPTEALNIKE